jgi:hypothetical protein
MKINLKALSAACCCVKTCEIDTRSDLEGSETSEVSPSINPFRFIPRFWLRMSSIRWRRSGEDSTSLGGRPWRMRREWINELRRSRNLALNFSRCRSVTPMKTLGNRELVETGSAADCSPELRPLKLDVLHAIPVDNSRPNSSDNPLSILGPIPSVIR